MTGLLFLLLPCMAVTSAHACPEGDGRCSDVSDCQDHIQPSQDQDGYYAALRTLLVDANAETYVIWMPSFWTESAVALQERSGIWYVRLSGVERPVWRWKDLDGDRSVLDFDVDQTVMADEREFPKDLAKRIADDWGQVLERTRKQDKSTTTVDGIGYVFAARGRIGEDANLSCGIGELMLDVAGSLAGYAKASDPISRWALRVRLRQSLLRIESGDFRKEVRR